LSGFVNQVDRPQRILVTILSVCLTVLNRVARIHFVLCRLLNMREFVPQLDSAAGVSS